MPTLTEDEELTRKLSILYEKTGVLVLRRCRLILRDEAEAEDVLQEVFLRVMKYYDSIRDEEVSLSWLYRTAERCCFDRLKKEKRTELFETDKVATLDPIDSSSARSESKQLILQYFRTLDPKLAQLAILYYVDELSQEEIARQLGWSRRTVGKKLKKLQDKGKKMAKKYEK